MAIWLLTIETSFASLAGLGFWFSLFSRIRSRGIYAALGLILWLFVAGSAGALVAGSFALQSHGSDVAYFPQALTFAALVAVGGFVLLIRNRPQHAEGPPHHGWSLGQQFVLWIALIALGWLIRHRLSASAQAFAAETRKSVAQDYAELTGPMPADDDNAADLYLAAFAQIDAVKKQFDREQEQKANAKYAATAPATEPADEPPDEVLTADNLLVDDRADRPETADLLKRLEPALNRVREGSNRPACRFAPPDDVPDVLKWTASSNSYLNEFRSAACAIETHAVQMSHRGDIDAALKDIQTINRLARQVDQTEPCLVPGLVHIGIQAVSYQTLVDILPYVAESSTPGNDVLPDEATISATFNRTMRGERAQVLGTALRFAEGDLSSGKESIQSAQVGMFYGILWLRSDVETARIYFQDLMNLRLDDADRSAHDGFRNASLLFQILLPSLSHAPVVYLRIMGTSRQTQIALALTRYRLKFGAYPAKLNALIPQWLPAIPVDPFDGKPMRYRLDGGDAIIYSVNEDRIDNGGQIENPAKDSGLRLRQAVHGNVK